MIFEVRPLIYNIKKGVHHEIGNTLYIAESSIQAINTSGDFGEIYVSWSSDSNVLITKERALQIIQWMDLK